MNRNNINVYARVDSYIDRIIYVLRTGCEAGGQANPSAATKKAKFDFGTEILLLGGLLSIGLFSSSLLVWVDSFLSIHSFIRYAASLTSSVGQCLRAVVAVQFSTLSKSQ